MTMPPSGAASSFAMLPLLLIAVGAVGTFALIGLGPTLLLHLRARRRLLFQGAVLEHGVEPAVDGHRGGGIAAINATSNLIGGGLLVNVYGLIHDATDSYVLALLPFAGLTVASAIAVVLVDRAASGAAVASRPAG